MLPAPFTILLIRYPWFHQWQVSRQKSPFWRLYFNDRPGATLYPENHNPVPIDPDHVYLIPQDTGYTGSSNTALRHGYIHFHTSWQVAPEIRSIPVDETLRSIIAAVQTHTPEGSDHPTRTFHAYRLLFEVFNRIQPSSLQTNPDEARLLPAISYIQNRLCEGIDVETLARISGMNVNRFIRTFRATYGLTPHRYLMVRRCEVAAARIEQTDDPIEVIAEATGFCDRYHFSKVFRQLREITPAAYRRSFRNHQTNDAQDYSRQQPPAAATAAAAIP